MSGGEALRTRIARQIAADGPLSVAAFMAACLHERRQGYYATGAGIGRDFITAPETSQVFGELIGLWAQHEWAALGAPEPVSLVEVGPGRGTLMADALRAARDARFRAAMALHLVEASPALREVQGERLAAALPVFHDGIETVPEGPMILVANEFLDCLPARQFVRDGARWAERVVGIGPDGGLAFGLEGGADPPLDMPPDADACEVQMGLEALVQGLAERLKSAPGRALFVDYGPADATPGDTLRAYREGAQVDPLAAPGECDLTVDVDFARLSRLARAQGLDVAGPAPQGAFLMRLGVEARMQALIGANPDRAESIHNGVVTLVDPGQMGARFKAVCLSSPGLPPPAGFGLEEEAA